MREERDGERSSGQVWIWRRPETALVTVAAVQMGMARRAGAHMNGQMRAIVGRPIAVVDVETTGIHVGYHHRIVEVAVLRFTADGELEHVVDTLVDPERDIGASEIHGITATQLVGAPTFREVAGDVEEALEGATVVAHNVMFDLRFLRSEFRRIGDPLPHLDLVDTMHLPHRMGLHSSGHALDAVAEAFGFTVDPDLRHTARGDAEICAQLFWRLAERLAEDGLSLHQFQLAAGWDPPDGSCMPGHPRWGRRYTRDHALSAADRQFGYLARLAHEVDRMPVVTWDERRETYIALLDSCLEDHLVTADERDALRDLARMLGMTGQDVQSAHDSFLERLVVAAWADGHVTDAEHRDLVAIGRWIGSDAASIDQLIDAARPDRQDAADDLSAPRLSAWTGMRVCFTGQLPSGMNRQQAHTLAETAGCLTSRNVTKAVDALIVADPHAKSGKAEKARQYGIRIVAADRFFRDIGEGMPHGDADLVAARRHEPRSIDPAAEVSIHEWADS